MVHGIFMEAGHLNSTCCSTVVRLPAQKQTLLKKCYENIVQRAMAFIESSLFVQWSI